MNPNALMSDFDLTQDDHKKAIGRVVSNQGILAQQKKPTGPISSAVAATGITALPQTDPDTDGRRVYSAGYGQAFANRQLSGIARQGPAISRPPGDGSVAQGPTSPMSAGDRTLPQTGIAALPPESPTGKPGRDGSGVITAELAKGIAADPMERSGGILGSMDMKGVNDIMARENKARGEMIDLSIKANGGNGIGILPDYQPKQQGGMSISDLQSAMKSAGTRTERAAYGQALNQSIAGQNQLALEASRQQGDLHQRGIAAGIDSARQAGIDQRAAERNQVQMRGQDLTAATATDRIASQERIAEQRTQDAGMRLTLPQRRSNFEIDAARERIAGMDPAEIKRRTANFTGTGRENPDFDPTLAKAVSLANRRKYGDDEHFDQRQREAANDVMDRFRSDRAMQHHKTGQMTDQGLEVFDADGRLIGHYR